MQVAKAPRKFKCSICQQKYTKIEDIRAHIKATHLVHVTCPLCDKVFANRIELLVHKKLHFQAAPDHLLQQTENINQAHEVKIGESIEEPSSGSSKGNAKFDKLGNCREVKPHSSFPFHTSNALSTEPQTQLPSSQDTVNNQDVAGEIKSADLNRIVSPDNLPRQREGKINEHSDKNSLMECDKIPLLSSTQKIVCFPLGDTWKVTAISVAPKESEPKVEEVTCAKEQELPDSKWVDEPETRAVALRSADKEGQSITKSHEESKTRADKCTNKPCLPLQIGSENLVVVPCNETQYVQLPKCIDMQSDVTQVSLNTHLDVTKDDTVTPREYSCNFCNHRYDNIPRVQSHMEEVHMSYLICLICNAKFSTRSQYLSHSNSHLNGSLPLSEEIKNCHGNSGEDSSFKTRTRPTSKVQTDGLSLKAKKGMASKLVRNKEYKCKLCQEKYFCVDDVRTHVKKVHLASLTCSFCNKIFADKYSLMDHLKMHNGSDINKPDKNSDICLSMSPKRDHEENETSVGGVSSDFSGSGIIVNSVGESNSGGQLTENMSYKCDHCCLYFDRESPLKAHQKAHKNILYKCGVCEFASFSKELVLVHLSQECHSFRGDLNEDY